ncbi:hypothetical protein SeMB42_g02780 [Synchytrium endobioticum]|uniref:CS domain-containing protein n=1 Tax=Synchytrium endobioticum TaxID=286115 RepID=A0A507D403_9FUNG|nr:hypothetical protein SeLEV6574_g03506 [Synchytrium endobioticum]TPX48998.1 hypothetical protein SeMB42_g02780 [Synchytrium endobioticum]
MPIVISEKEYSWSQTDSTLSISIPTKSKAADTYINSVYIKANFAPYFFELDLLHPILPHQSTAVIADDRILFTLTKKHSTLWNTVKCTDKDVNVRERRKKAEQEELDRMEQLRRSKIEEKAAASRKLVKQQIEVERAERERIQGEKDAQKQRIEEELEAWERKLQESESNVNMQALSGEEAASAPRTFHSIDETIHTTSEQAQALALDDVEIDESEIDMEAIRAKVRKQLAATAPPERPPPRKPGHITVVFTNRKNLPTTVAREREDAKWQARIDEAMKKHQMQASHD